MDLSFAYQPAAGGRPATAACWAPVHQQWCMLLSFSATLVRTLGQYVDVRRGEGMKGVWV